ncbi:TAXI family TRAP transporter solute-binding subunit [Nocardiopsis sp. N85]|uniref:TAXI family TRAP transporter solute-binding subunit n=1 Tax=Nocardiopsis sp. N85 TaxID=3029400 RepID=UPI00237F7EBF|nr:TAXI family TRAP transporter solute-binding subunit [Nocardiopsis sp. N85]MDE3720601.1 TAXI family TRAP transporter solute-binding subunit [Nocardiopsis sp. N85]
MSRSSLSLVWPLTAALLVLTVSTPLLTRAEPREAPPVHLSLGTGGTGGVYHEYGAALARIVSSSHGDVRITALTTAASVENNRLVAEGSLDAAFTLADVSALAVAGDPPFDEPLPINAIARLYDNHTHVVVRADSPYRSLSDLAGSTVSVGAKGSGTEMMAERLLDLVGLEEDGGPDAGVHRLRLSIGGSASALERGAIDAFFWSGGLPTQAVADLAERFPIRLLDLSEHVNALSEEHGAYFSELPVPASTYPGVPAVRTIGVPSLLVVGAGMPRPTAEELTRLLFDSRAELAEIHPVALQLHPRSAIATLPVPLHPGAAGYYQEVKYAHDRVAESAAVP